MEHLNETKANILIVDDDILIAESTKFQLKKAGYNISGIATNDKEAIQVARENNTDLILMDINLGSSRDGIVTAAEIQKIADIPFIFLTAYSDNATIERAKKIGPFAYLIKPFNNRELLVAIETSLYKHSVEKRNKEQELLFRTVADFAYEWEYWILPDLQFKYCSPSCERVSGYKSEEFFADPNLLFSLIHPDDKNDHARHMEEHHSIETHETIRDFQFRINTKQGNVRYINHTCSPIYDDKGNYLGRRVTNADITERKQAEVALIESEKRFRILYENAPLSYQSLDIKGYFIDVNPTWLNVMGYSRKEVIGRHFTEFMTKDSAKLVEKRFPAFMKAGEIHNYEFEMIRKDGTHLIVSYEGNIGYDELGNFKQTHCIFTDITERKRSEEALKRSEERYRSLFNEMMDGVYRSTHDGRFVDVNPAMVKMFGYSSKEELLKVDIKKELYFSPEERESLFLDNGEEKIESFPMRRKDGSVIWVEDHGHYVNDEKGNVLFHEGILRDITERKKLESGIRIQSEIASNIAEGIYLVSAENLKIVYANERMESIFGYKPGEMLGRHVSVINAPSDADPVQTARDIENAVKTQGVWRGEVLNKRKDGTPFWAQTSISYLDNSEYGPVYVSLQTDITERKRAEEAVLESEKRYRALVEGSPDAISIYVDGKIVYANSACANLMHVPNVDDLIAKPAIQFVHQDYREFATKRMAEIMESSEPLPIAEEKFIRPDGSVVDVEVKAFPITFNKKSAIQVIVRDITERKLAESVIRESEKRYRQLADNAPIPVIVAEQKTGKFLYVNKKAYELAAPGMTDKDPGNFRVTDFYLNPEKRNELLNQLHKKGSLSNFEIELKSRDGNKITALASSSVTTFENQPAIFTSFYDITERKEMEKELKSSRERWESLFNNSPSSIAVYQAVENGNDFIFTDFNKSAQKTDKISHEEVIGKRISSLFPAAEKLGFLDVFKRVWRTGNTEFINAAIYKDNRIQGWRDNIIYRLNTGEIVAIYSDVTEKMKAEIALRESEEKFRKIFENHSAIKLLIDPDTGDIVDANKAAAKYYGWELGELRHMNISQINMLPLNKIKNEMKEILTLNNNRLEFKHRLKNGSVRDVEVFSSKIEIGGKIFLHSINHDITDKKLIEESLRQSSLRYETLFNKAGDGIVILSKDGNIIAANDSFANMHGFEAEELISSNISQFITTPDSTFNDRLSRTLSGESHRFITKHKHKEGNEIILEVTVSMIKIGDEILIQGFHRDITDKIAKEENLRKLYKAVDQSPVSIVITNLNAEIEYVNPKFTQVTGYTPEEAINKNPRVLKTGEQSPEFYKELWDTILSGKNWKGTFHNKKKNGELFWESAIISPIKNESGKTTHFVAVKEDITEKVEKENELKKYREHLEELVNEKTVELSRQNKFLETLLDTIPNPVFVLDRTRKITLVNKSFEKYFNKKRKMLIGKSLAEFIPPDLEGNARKYDEKLLKKKGSIVYESYNLTNDNEKKAQLVFKASYGKEGEKPDGITGLIVDISEQRRMEQQTLTALEREKELNEMKTNFISMASHEFRTPLTTILASADLLEMFHKKWDENKISEHFKKIQDSVEYMTSLLDEVLTISRTDRGKVTFNPAKVNLEEMCIKLFDKVKVHATYKHIFKLNYNLPYTIAKVDNKLLNHILGNLLTNAIKFTPGGGNIELSVSKNEENISFSVKDDGIGIPGESRGKLFEPFYRAPNSAEIEGTGLGLSIVKKYVEIHRGKISLTSTENKGTEFIVKIKEELN